MDEGSAGGQEQIPREVAVVRSGNTPSKVWDHFTRFTTADGQAKAKCNNCSAELVADTKNAGTSHLSRHVNSCRKVWEHFTRVTTADGEAKAKCMYCSAELVADNKLLSRHDKSCRKLATDGTRGEHPPRPRAASESSNMNPDYKEAYEDLARMIALRGYDSSIVEDDYFRSFVRRLDPAFEVPLRRTIERMCDGVFDEAKRDLSSKLERARTSGRVNVATRTAKTIEGTVLCTACHFIDDEWNLLEMIRNAHMVVHPRDVHVRAQLLGIMEVDLQRLQQDMRDYDIASYLFDGDDHPPRILHRLFSVACPREIVSDQLQLEKYLQYMFSGAYPVKRQLIYTRYMDSVLHSIAQGLLDIIRHGDDDDYYYYYRQLYYSCHVKFTRQQREKHLLQLSLPDLWTYNDRWYACYCSLEVAQNVRSSTIKEDDDTLRYLGERESEFARLLRKLWGTIYRAIQTISATNRPASNLCLRELFKVREALESKIERDSIEANVETEFYSFIDREDVPDVLRKAKNTLDESIQESYLVWSIPLVLDPRYKLSYRVEEKFKSAFGSNAEIYISKIRSKLKDIFTDYSQGDNETSHGDSNGGDEMAVDSTDPLQQASQGHRPLQESKTELDDYLKDRCFPETERDDFDILKWWKDHSSTYPTVARMARDALAMATCSKLSSELMSHITYQKQDPWLFRRTVPLWTSC